MGTDKLKRGCMVISLDLEMLWGVLDHENIADYLENIRNVWKAVPLLLKIFSKYKIHATWGVTGLLTENSLEQCGRNMPVPLPSYSCKKYSAYEYFEYLRTVDKKYLFAPGLVKRIQKTEGQEIGTHTYSHFYCMEDGQTAEQFEADLIKAEESLEKYGIYPKSIIFPRNQFNEKYADILKKHRFENYRGNEDSWFYRSAGKTGYCMPLRRACRFLDNYVPIAGDCCYKYEDIYDSSGLKNIRSSRFFRPYSKKTAIFEPLRMKRIKRQMEYAAKHHMVFHLWWHPHNFGRHLEHNLHNLELLLKYFCLLNQLYGFESKNMSEV